MIDCGEHIEETIKLFKQNGLPLRPHDITECVLDTIFAQGGIEESELDLAHKEVQDQVRYMLEPHEFKEHVADVISTDRKEVVGSKFLSLDDEGGEK